jgi:hypothetical protein
MESLGRLVGRWFLSSKVLSPKLEMHVPSRVDVDVAEQITLELLSHYVWLKECVDLRPRYAFAECLLLIRIRNGKDTDA